MSSMKTVIATSAAALAIALMPAPKANAQVSVNIGVAPACPYGYYDYAPYNCAPYGFYGPEWFNGGVFIGAGPWFHGPHDFRGGVDRSYDPRYGYKGAYPEHGAYHAPPANHQEFHASHMSDGHGHYSEAGHGGHGGHGR
ncbi:hypothetical protein [Granulicella sp. L46]|jgi:hypothetical protein|uniref:hypothetical protein n=1 Tax=Granulicella sp. L46 TaxID=1641865 RepID=UPI00131DA961|nr:hypothetical protein [Granulicella sp. L46]